MGIVEATAKSAAARFRHFIRFGEIPEDGKSRMWTAPNSFLHDRIGQSLPGLSAYHAKRERAKWALMTDDINVGSGIASLFDLFQAAVDAPDSNKIYLLKGVATTWKGMTPHEQDIFDYYYPGKGREGFEILGTDGEPLVRNFEIISTINVSELICRMISFPDDWEEKIDTSEVFESDMGPGV